MNNVCLTGNLGQHPEIRYFESGKCKASFSLAVRGYKGDTDWFDVEAWGKTAEIVANYAKKGSKIGISGSLKKESWEDKNTGTKRSKIIVSANQVDLLSSKSEAKESNNDFAF